MTRRIGNPIGRVAARLFVLVALSLTACRASQRDEPPTAEPAVEEPAPPPPWQPPAGAVLTVTSALSSEAPAGLLDRAAALRLRLIRSGASDAELLLPLPATGTWVVPDARGVADLEVKLVTTAGEVLAENRFRTGTLDGMVGTLRFEVAPGGELEPCFGCTAPALLSDVQGFIDTGLWYSVGGHSVSEHGDVLRVGLRPWIGDAEARRIAEGAGGAMRGAPVDAEGLRWIEVEAGARPVFDVAMGLANEAAVRSVGW